MITKGRTDVLDGFVSKSKKKFPAALVLQKDEEGKINISFDFSANEPQVWKESNARPAAVTL